MVHGKAYVIVPFHVIFGIGIEINFFLITYIVNHLKSLTFDKSKKKPFG